MSGVGFVELKAAKGFQAPGPNPAKGRSPTTNRRRLLPVDLRSPQGRRFKDLCRIYAADLGGLDQLAEGDLALVRTAAGLTVESERLQCLIVEGKGVNHDAIVRLSSETRRVLERLEARSAALQQQRQQPQAGAGLQEFLSNWGSSTS